MSSHMGLDLTTATREQFTQNIIAQPDNPRGPNTTKWSAYRTHLNNLLDLLAHHDAMAPNLRQPYMTPANSKNKVYFMWDFVGRTRGMLEGVRKSEKGDEMWEDVVGRSQYAVVLIKDKTGQLETMLSAPYGKNFDQAVFGEEVLEAADRLASI